MFTCFLLLMEPVLGDDRSCHTEQLNLLQLRNGLKADALGMEPDSDDVDALDVSEKTFPGSTSFVELEQESFDRKFRLGASTISVDGKPPSSESYTAPPSDYSIIYGVEQHFWPVTSGGQEAVVWWCKDSKAVKMTVVDSARTITLLKPEV